MRRNRRPLLAITASLLLVIPAAAPQFTVSAETTNAPSLVISQLKITSSNGQFVTLYNKTNTTLDMSKYQLEYFNSYDLSKATSSRLIALVGSVPPHGYFMVNDAALLLCYQLSVDSISLGLSSTAGLVEVLAFNQTTPGSSVAPVLQDYVGWSKTAATGAQTLPTAVNAWLLRQPVDTRNNPVVSVPGDGSWQAVQPDSSNACNLVTTASTPTAVSTGLNQLLPPTEPPATLINLPTEDTGDASLPGLPSTDLGLMAPQVSEILPNPNGTGNDSSEEFIELYNANPLPFDLNGFSLQVGTTTLHSYKFPAGTILPASGFTAFYSADTGLSLSNTRGQAKLLDPFGNSISSTNLYETAKDGQAWALAKGKWYWTLRPTPGAANVITQPQVAKKTTRSAASKTAPKAGKTAAGRVKAAKTKQKVTTTAHAQPAAKTTPIHVWTLALIASLALLYGAYEYRTDLANRVYQLRRYFKTWRTGRS